jgi:RimJ/RimL family protein N-acetyltransferase
MLWDSPSSREEISSWTEKTLDLWRSGVQYTFSIRSKITNDFIGRIVIRPKKPEDQIWYLGYWIHPQRWNQGYATEAAFTMLKFGFSQLGAKRIESSHALWNKASAAVIRKLGMQFRGENPKGFMKRGEWVAEGEYYLDAEKFQP